MDRSEVAKSWPADMAQAEDITPCPVPWCEDAGTDGWPREIDGSRGARLHGRETVTVENGPTVSAQVLEPDGGPLEPSVDVSAGELHNPDEVIEMVDGLLQAADLAFSAESQVVAGPV